MSGNSTRRAVLGCVVAVVCLTIIGRVHAVSYDSVGNGNWTNDSTWSGTGYPQSGDQANIIGLHNIGVTSNEVFSGGGITVAAGGADPDIEIQGTNTLTLDGGTFNVNHTSSDSRINGTGTFINSSAATFQVSNTGNFLLGVGSSPTFENHGIIDVSNTGHFQLFSGTLEHKSGAKIQRTVSGQGNVSLHSAGSAPTMTAESGSIFEATASDSILHVLMRNTAGDSLGTVTDAIFQGNGQIEFEGYWTEISGTILGNANVELQSTVSTAHYIPAGGTSYDVQGNSSGLHWVSSHMLTASGQNATNNGIFSLTGSALQINGSGEFINGPSGTFRYAVGTTNDTFVGVSGGATVFRNRGTFDFLDAGVTSRFHTYVDGTAFINDSTAVLRRDVAGISQFVRHSSQTAGTTTFTNLGTVEVTAGEIEIAASQDTTSIGSSGTELTEGTWNILSGTGTAILDLQAGGTSAGSITTIGSSAKVVLGGNNPVFSQLSTGTLTVNGALGAQDQYVKALSGDLTVASGAILEIGLELADQGGALVTGWDVAGNVSLTGGIVDVLDLGTLDEGTYRFLEWDGTRTGTLTLGTTPTTIPDGQYELLLTDVGGGTSYYELSVFVPEPASALLLGLGMLMMIRRRRTSR